MEQTAQTVQTVQTAQTAQTVLPFAVGTGAATGGRSARVAEAARRLGSVREARWIVEHAHERGGEWEALVERRLGGEPLQYVLGTWPFRGIELRIDRRVLIPRPETEQVAEVALRELAGPVCVDLGTGSGAIALSLATEGAPHGGGALEVWATDISSDALAVAAGNLESLPDAEARARVRLARGSWFGALPCSLEGKVDLIVSNPPYVPETEVAGLDPEVRDWEPEEALAAAPGTCGTPGMAAIEAIVAGAPEWLAPDGVVVVELDPSQAGPAADAARRTGLRSVSVEQDLAGRDRMLVARR